MKYVLMLILFFLTIPAWCKVNVNTAMATEIADELLGVGEQRSQAIVEYRKIYGPFKSLADLDAVKGIGPKTLQKNKGRITLK